MIPPFSTEWLYHYLTEPFKTIENHSTYTPVIEGFFILSLLGFHSAIMSQKPIWVWGIAITLCGMTLTWIYSALSGVCAKLFGCETHINTTYHWYAVAAIPGLLAIPFELITPSDTLQMALSIFTGSLGFILQIKTIQAIYALPIGKAIIVTLAPCILAILVALSITVIFFSSLLFKVFS